MTDTNLSIHNIVCPTDFSEFAASAFAESVRLARWFGAKVTVLHVVPLAVPIVGDMGYLPVPEETGDTARPATLAELQRFVDATEHTGVPIGLLCREGDPCEEIRNMAQETGADLVVMGTHGRSGFKRLVLGSVTEALLNRPPAPVLTVNRDLKRRKGLFRTVLCAIDVSEWSAGTVAVALAIADEGAKRIMLLNVIEHHVESFGGAVERAALAALHDLIPDEARSSYAIDERVTFGESEREILGVAVEQAADLVVMGTRSGGALGHLFGSTVRRVVRDASCPVLVVPAGYSWPATGLVVRPDTQPIAAVRRAEGARAFHL
jgi:nucleotide-binding universal stress UspA family protein